MFTCLSMLICIQPMSFVWWQYILLINALMDGIEEQFNFGSTILRDIFRFWILNDVRMTNTKLLSKTLFMFLKSILCLQVCQCWFAFNPCLVHHNVFYYLLYLPVNLQNTKNKMNR
jgi:hypothetical protein